MAVKRVIPFNPTLPAGLAVEVYWNLHKHVFSVRDRKTGLVIGHCDEVKLHTVRFRVFEPGRQRVIRQKRKNVHAFVRGTIRDGSALIDAGCFGDGSEVARYNPYDGPHFVTASSGVPIEGAETALLVAQQGTNGARRGLVMVDGWFGFPLAAAA